MYKFLTAGPIELDVHTNHRTFDLGGMFVVDCMGASLHLSLGFLTFGVAYWRSYDTQY